MTWVPAMKKSRSLAVLLWLLAAFPAQASPELCEAAALRAAGESGVPADVMLAITLTETGRSQQGRLRPWPWTANAEGAGHWFDTRDEALAFARGLLARGQRLFDLGCFQINWRWHGAQFSAPEALLDPLLSARYAARLLATLRDELGSWEAAAGAYHSRNPEFANRYRARFDRIRADLRDLPAPREPPPSPDPAPRGAPRVNTYPLLAGRASGASLVPAALPAARPFLTANP